MTARSSFSPLVSKAAVIQRSKLQPFWSPWRVKKSFGNQNSGESRQLVTDRLKEKLNI